MWCRDVARLVFEYCEIKTLLYFAHTGGLYEGDWYGRQSALAVAEAQVRSTFQDQLFGSGCLYHSFVRSGAVLSGSFLLHLLDNDVLWNDVDVYVARQGPRTAFERVLYAEAVDECYGYEHQGCRSDEGGGRGGCRATHARCDVCPPGTAECKAGERVEHVLECQQNCSQCVPGSTPSPEYGHLDAVGIQTVDHYRLYKGCLVSVIGASPDLFASLADFVSSRYDFACLKNSFDGRNLAIRDLGAVLSRRIELPSHLDLHNGDPLKLLYRVLKYRAKGYTFHGQGDPRLLALGRVQLQATDSLRSAWERMGLVSGIVQLGWKRRDVSHIECDLQWPAILAPRDERGLESR